MVGSQAKLLAEYGELFTEEEKSIVLDHIDRDYSKIMEISYVDDGDLIWKYLEKKESSPNDAIHHGFILEGIYDYQKYRLREDPLKDKNYTSYLYKCIKDNIIYSTPEYLKHSCFNTGTIRWISSKEVQKEILLKSYDLYFNQETNKRQLTFLLDSFSLYLSNEN